MVYTQHLKCCDRKGHAGSTPAPATFTYMLTKKQLEERLNKNPLVGNRLETLRLAEKINPDFHSPHIIGGFLRNISLGVKPNDCDVVFQGNQLNQPGIVEAVREAEKQLRIEPYPDWDFENAMATGQSDNFFENTVGKNSNHTDYITNLMVGLNGVLYLGDEKTLSDIENRTYDFRFSGIEVWASHRGKGRSYTSCIVGDLTRGLYLCTILTLTPSAIVSFLMSNYDVFFKKLDLEDQENRRSFWLKKTKGNIVYQNILDRFGIKSLLTKAP